MVSGLAERLNVAAAFVDRHVAEGRGGRTAFRHAGRTLTYAGLAEQAGRAGAALAALGVEAGDRVLLVLDDVPAFAVAFWGAARLGAVAVPLNPLMSDEEYAFVLDDSRAAVVVAEPAVAARLAALRPARAWPRAIVAAGGPAAGALDLGELLAKASAPPPTAPTRPEDVVYWGYTSGSTGPPKAAVHTHAHFTAAADHVGVGVFGLGPDDLVFSASKMYFAFGLGNTLYFPARVGAAAVLAEGRIAPERAFAIIAAERPTAFFAVATLYARMLEVPDAARRFDLSSLRLCVSSGEALPAAVFDGWKARFGLELTDVVGSTEALHDFIANRPGAARRGSAGQLVPGFEARLVDDAGQPVADGAVGHLLIKGPTVAEGYWNRPDRTRSTMAGGWLRTGDMFRRDSDGHFYFAGRADDMLKVGGRWVSPAEVEARLGEHPAVLEAGVVGATGADGLMTPRAFVVLRSGVAGSPALAAELAAFARAGLAAYKAPRRIDFVADLPRTATGKVQRFRLRAP